MSAIRWLVVVAMSVVLPSSPGSAAQEAANPAGSVSTRIC